MHIPDQVPLVLLKSAVMHAKFLTRHSNQNNIHFDFSYYDRGQPYMQVFGMAQQPELYILTQPSYVDLPFPTTNQYLRIDHLVCFLRSN